MHMPYELIEIGVMRTRSANGLLQVLLPQSLKAKVFAVMRTRKTKSTSQRKPKPSEVQRLETTGTKKFEIAKLSEKRNAQMHLAAAKAVQNDGEAMVLCPKSSFSCPALLILLPIKSPILRLSHCRGLSRPGAPTPPTLFALPLPFQITRHPRPHRKRPDDRRRRGVVLEGISTLKTVTSLPRSQPPLSRPREVTTLTTPKMELHISTAAAQEVELPIAMRLANPPSHAT